MLGKGEIQSLDQRRTIRSGTPSFYRDPDENNKFERCEEQGATSPDGLRNYMGICHREQENP